MIIDFFVDQYFFATKWRLGFIIQKSCKKTLATKWQSRCLLQNGFPESFLFLGRISEWSFCSVHKSTHSVVEIQRGIIFIYTCIYRKQFFRTYLEVHIHPSQSQTEPPQQHWHDLFTITKSMPLSIPRQGHHNVARWRYLQLQRTEIPRASENARSGANAMERSWNIKGDHARSERSQRGTETAKGTAGTCTASCCPMESTKGN